MINCSASEPSTCDNYCDMRSEAAIQDAEYKLCGVYPSSLEQFEDKCDTTCNQVLEYMVDKAEQKDAKTCLDCIIENTTEPSQRNMLEATEECFEICNTLGNYQFFFSFYVSPPQWDCY
jgi:hypothetical protein